MGNLRYRKIRFKQLHKGSNQLYYDRNNPNKFNTSLGLIDDVKTGRLKLAEEFDKFTIASGHVIEYYAPVCCSHFVGSTEYLYHFIERGSNIYVYSKSGYATPVQKYMFTAGLKDPALLLSYLGRIFAFYQNASSEAQLDISSNDGTNFSNIRCPSPTNPT